MLGAMTEGPERSQGTQSASQASSLGVLEVDATLTNPLMFTAMIYTLNIDVNGQRFPGKWARNAASYPPGRYKVEVSFASLFGDWAAATAVVDIIPGYATVLRYSPGMLMGLDTSLQLTGQLPLAPGA
jgi:hypothetical protein